jgi:hypothetical protein
MNYSNEARAICTALNKFNLPRAVANLHQDRFVAWNESFLSECGLSSEQLQKVSVKESITFQETPAVTPNSGRSVLSLVHFKFKCGQDMRVLSGNAAKNDDGFIFFIVDLSEKSLALENAWKQGHDEEHHRILKLFHEEVGPKLLVAIFSAQVAKEELEAKGLKESETVASIADQLAEVIEGIVAVLSPETQAEEENQSGSREIALSSLNKFRRS